MISCIIYIHLWVLFVGFTIRILNNVEIGGNSAIIVVKYNAKLGKIGGERNGFFL